MTSKETTKDFYRYSACLIRICISTALFIFKFRRNKKKTLQMNYKLFVIWENKKLVWKTMPKIHVKCTCTWCNEVFKKIVSFVSLWATFGLETQIIFKQILFICWMCVPISLTNKKHTKNCLTIHSLLLSVVNWQFVLIE